MFNIVLVEPEIPANTGNIARTCAITNCSLHLVKPLGFSLDDKHLKRAGLDYWHLLDIHIYENLDEFLAAHGDKTLYLATTKAQKHYTDMQYKEGDFSSSAKRPKVCPLNYAKPMPMAASRSLCWITPPPAPSISPIPFPSSFYEAFRQIGFKGLI